MNYQPGEKVIIKDFDSDMEVEAAVERIDGEYLELRIAGAGMFDMPARLHQKDVIRKSGHRVYLIDEALIDDDRSIFGVAAGDSVLIHNRGRDYPAKVAHVNVDGHVDVIPTGEWPRGMYTDGIDLAAVRAVSVEKTAAAKKDDPYSSVGNMIGTANSTINDMLEMFESFNLEPINAAEEHLRAAKQSLMEAMPMVDKFVGASKTAGPESGVPSDQGDPEWLAGYEQGQADQGWDLGHRGQYSQSELIDGAGTMWDNGYWHGYQDGKAEYESEGHLAGKTASERWDDVGATSFNTEFRSGDQVSFTENGQQLTGTISEVEEIGDDEAALTISGDDGSYHRNVPAGSAQKIAQFGEEDDEEEEDEWTVEDGIEFHEPWKEEDLEKDAAYDETEDYRRQEKQELDSFAGERQQLESQYGQVWDTDELQQDFSVEGFMAPYVVATRKADGVRGSLMFQSSPRFYFNFSPE